MSQNVTFVLHSILCSEKDNVLLLIFILLQVTNNYEKYVLNNGISSSDTFI